MAHALDREERKEDVLRLGYPLVSGTHRESRGDGMEAEDRAAEYERLAEAALEAEEYYRLILEADREDALELIRDLLRLVAWEEIFAERLRAAHGVLTNL
jgi:hypothetical protein